MPHGCPPRRFSLEALNVLFGVSATNPLAVIGGAALVLSIALVTTLVAVSGAIRVSPASVLREE